MTPDNPLTPPELEMFAALIASGKTEREAFIQSSAGVAMCSGLSGLLTPAVRARTDWLRRNAPVTGDPAYNPETLCRADIVRMLLGARLNALKLGNASAEVKAVELLGKSIGVFEEHVKVDTETVHRVIIVPAKQATMIEGHARPMPDTRSLALTRGNGRGH